MFSSNWLLDSVCVSMKASIYTTVVLPVVVKVATVVVFVVVKIAVAIIDVVDTAAVAAATANFSVA